MRRRAVISFRGAFALRRRRGGAAAVLRALVPQRSPSAPLRWLARAVGRRRRGSPASRLWSALSGPTLARRGLGVVYHVAFASLGAQVLGLYGERGIAPARRTLERVERAGRADPAARADGAPADGGAWRRFRAVPSLLWLDPSDAGLRRLAAIGELAGAALAFDLCPRLAAAVAWCAYLSFVSVGRPFMSFQWDVLLLEAGLVAVLGWPRRPLSTLLALRLQLESGVAKLASRDPTWRDLSACSYHQETQPLPTVLGWYAHHLPRSAQKLGTGLTLLVECGVPPLALGPRPVRAIAFGILTGFQALIALTGNYGFFNPLTVVLDLALIERPAPSRAARRARAARGAVAALDGAAGATLLALGVSDLVGRLWPRVETPRALARLGAALEPLHVTGSYGLFAVMTTSRPEVVIEGSRDGAAWREYGFRYKPGDVTRAPRWAAPHQPRLDWQMWFAALGPPPAWFARFVARLLEGSPEVLALLETNPFPGAPPRYVRALLYDYEMTDLATRAATGAWWRRTPAGLYFPTSSLRDPSSQE
jgi:hypothetical protein